ncbi:DUF4118 domain-containing protein [Bradyrhizobium septentrionale]|uniref:DUF4118 domain-containing protein n=1 Tax=Bradyrhizobium septentrionale TaxID=1404411 RepID=UPI001596B4A3|nr:DUF4118 domain-containing protein [Bradyrhizobium septentrionale]UGY23130.1 DUF4118 domain-containing protein [Bradyrhizobium septentrionale]
MKTLISSRPRSSEANRHLALQLAIQLPSDSAEDARQVVDELAVLLEGYMTAPGPRPLWERQVMALDPPYRAGLALFWTVALFLLVMPVAMALVSLVGIQAVEIPLMAPLAAGCSMVFGRRYGVLVGVLAGVAHNLLIVPPALELSIPTARELVFGGCYAVAAIVVPTIARHSAALRAAAMSACVRLAPAPGSPSPG